jgi:hypothetical protein
MGKRTNSEKLNTNISVEKGNSNFENKLSYSEAIEYFLKSGSTLTKKEFCKKYSIAPGKINEFLADIDYKCSRAELLVSRFPEMSIKEALANYFFDL